jgi:ankyrin repeat protein
MNCDVKKLLNRAAIVLSFVAISAIAASEEKADGQSIGSIKGRTTEECFYFFTNQKDDFIESHINKAAFDGATPLIFGVWTSHSYIVEKLLLLKADPNLPDSQGRTPLCEAAGKFSCGGETRYLIDGKANVHQRNKQGQTPLERSMNMPNIEAMEALFAAGADPNAVTSRGIPHLQDWLDIYQSLDTARTLINAKATIDEALIIRAQSTGNIRIPVEHHDKKKKLLLDAYCARLTSDDQERTPLENSIVRDDRDAMQALINAKADIESPGATGLTPLRFAIRLGSEPAVAALIASKVNVDEPDRDGLSPLVIALLAGQDALALSLVQADADISKPSLLAMALEAGCIQAAHRLLELGADVNGAGDYIPLHTAIRSQQVSMVKALLDRGALVDSSLLLYLAVHGNNPEIRDLLCAAGARDYVSPEFTASVGGSVGRALNACVIQ